MTQTVNFLRTAVLLLVMIVIFIAATPVVMADETISDISVWNGSAGELEISGSGRTASDPIIIDSAGELAALAKLTNDGKSFRGVYFRLEADINLDNIPWTPIGNADAPFEGFFDGNGHTIYNMYVYEFEYSGLFGSIESYGVVSDLSVNGNIFASGALNQCFAGGISGICAGRISGCYYRGTIDISALGSCYTGGITGGLGGKVSACVSYAAVITGQNGAKTCKSGGISGYSSGGGIENCRSDGQVTANAENLALTGGITGDNYSGNITGCISKPTIYASAVECSAGGIAGNVQTGRIDRCSNMRSVAAYGTSEAKAGGIAGESDGYITNCSNSGDISADGRNEFSGGIVGTAGQGAVIINCFNLGSASYGIAAEFAGTIENCFVAGTDEFSGSSCTVKNCFAATLDDDISGICNVLNEYVNGLGSEFSTWKVDSGRTGYPVFSDEFIITVSTGNGGSISPSGSVAVERGENISFDIIPKDGCVVSSVIVDGVNIGPTSQYTFSNISCGHTIEAVFTGSGEHTVTIVSQAGAGGSITPDGFTEVVAGRDVTYKIQPESGYAIERVTVDGEDMGAISSYTFAQVDTSHTIEASFSSIEPGKPVSQGGRFTVTSSSGEGGNIEFEGDISISGGESITLVITPDTGWSIKNVCVDGENLGAITSYTFENISSNHTITAEFDINAAGGEPDAVPDETDASEPKSVFWIVWLILTVMTVGYIIWRKLRKLKTLEEKE